MRPVLLAVLLLASACVRSNPDFVAGGSDAGTVPIPGPGVDGGIPGGSDGSALDPADLMSMEPAHDLGMSSPDLAMSEPTNPESDGVVCGDAICDAPQFCCNTFGSHVCTTPFIAACAAGKDFRCDGPEDCADGARCCMNLDGSSCRENCMGAPRLCHEDEDCGSSAPHCCPSVTTDYKICSNQDC